MKKININELSKMNKKDIMDFGINYLLEELGLRNRVENLVISGFEGDRGEVDNVRIEKLDNKGNFMVKDKNDLLKEMDNWDWDNEKEKEEYIIDNNEFIYSNFENWGNKEREIIIFCESNREENNRLYYRI